MYVFYPKPFVHHVPNYAVKNDVGGRRSVCTVYRRAHRANPCAASQPRLQTHKRSHGLGICSRTDALRVYRPPWNERRKRYKIINLHLKLRFINIVVGRLPARVGAYKTHCTHARAIYRCCVHNYRHYAREHPASEFRSRDTTAAIHETAALNARRPYPLGVIAVSCARPNHAVRLTRAVFISAIAVPPRV